MRVTNSLFYTNAANDYQRNMQELYKTNTQISSGLKIQNSFEDSGTYVDAMRLNYEVATLEQVKESSSKAQTYANNTDQVFNQFTDALTQFKTKLIQSANETNSETSLNALANELQVLRDHMVSLGNTSINGKYLFSGSAVKIKPVSSDGTYNGNAGNLEATIGSNVKLPYNIDGQSLFLGKDSDYSKIVSTNVVMYNQTTQAASGDNAYLKSSDTIQDMVGGDETTNGTPVFYLSGRKSNGDTFNTKIPISTTSKVSNLLDKIGTTYGNTSTNQIVNVSLNDYGQIEVKDLQQGNSLLQMNLFGAIDRTGSGAVGGADQSDIELLSSQANVEIISFLKSNFTNSDALLSDTSNYSIRGFEKDGDTLSGNVSQFAKSTNIYATSMTKISDVAGSSSLNGKKLLLTGNNINGTTFNAEIDFNTSGSTFSLDGGTTNYTLFDANGNATSADEVTYQQLNDVVSMITSNILPTSINTAIDYNTAVTAAQKDVSVTLDAQGKMQIKDNNNSVSQIDFTMYDADANTFNGTAAPALTFMANDAIMTDEPNVNIFQQLDSMIQAVKNGNNSMDSSSTDPRNIGIQNSILQIDHISDHVIRMQTKIGSYSNALSQANDRSSLLSINVQTVRSEVIDVDVGEAYMKFNQLSNSYQAMLSTVAKINSMTLLNYM